LIRFLAKVANKDNPLEVKETVAGRFNDLRYCYGDEKTPIEVTVDYNSIFTSEQDLNYSLRRMFIPGREKNEMIMVHPESFAADEKLWKWEEDLESHYGGQQGLVQAHNDDPELWKKHQKEADCMLHEADDAKKKVVESETDSFKAYADLWRRMKFVSSFREKPHAVYNGSRHAEYRGFDALPISPDGSDLGEFLAKHARDTVNAGYDISSICPMLYPGSASVERIEWDEDGRKRSQEVVCGNELTRQLQLWLNEVSPGARIFTEKVEVSDDEKYIMSVGFEDDKDSKHRFKPQNVGFGISYVLPVLIALLTSKRHDIVLIENPEAHLHPKGQAAMGNLIARAVASCVQVFVETHSDHVVNGIRSAVKDGIVTPKAVNIAFFERKEHDVLSGGGMAHQEIYSEVRNIRVDKNGSLSEYPDGFLDEWNNQLMELI